MNILVTGGAGFIGSHLVEALLDCGNKVTVLDNLSSGRLENLQHLSGRDALRFVKGDILDPTLVNELVSECEQVYHLASAVGVFMVMEDPVQTVRTICEGTAIVLKAASKKGCRTLITSSSEVYGKGVRAPFAEGQDLVLGPTHVRRWVYACAKMIDEFLAIAYWEKHQIPTVCVRLFNAVGPRQSGGMVWSCHALSRWLSKTSPCRFTVQADKRAHSAMFLTLSTGLYLS